VPVPVALPVLLDELASLEAASGRLAARRVRVLAAIHGVEVSQWAAEAGAGGGPVGYESVAGRDRHWVSEEVGLILRVAGVTARDRLLHADQLVTRLPETVAALAVGVLHPLQAQRLSEAVIALTDEQCAQVQERALAKAAANPSQSVTGFTRTLQRIVMSTVPKTAEQAHTDALAEARVEVCPLDHGMALLLAWLPAPDALRVAAAIHARAHLTGPTTDPTGSTGPGACQVIDARRAQALVELIDLGACADPAATAKPAPAAIQVTISLQTLLGVDEQPAELNGYGPIPASMARQIAADPTSTWRRLVTDPLGKLIDYGRDRYEPPPELANHIRARDQVCTFPNCHRRAISCELDHVQPWAQGGHTNTDNLIAACARHHHLKHDGGWTNHYNPTTGTTTWTSPTTRTYHNPPPDLPTTHHPPTQHPPTQHPPTRHRSTACRSTGRRPAAR
jgi:Domain of unknown function (DUF222)/HNH endonuclease